MATNSLREYLGALQHLVAFAEGETSTFPALLLSAGEGLVTQGSHSLGAVAALTPRAIEILQAELRIFLREAAAGHAHMIAPYAVSITVIATDSAQPPGRRRRRRPKEVVSLIVDGTPRDLLFDQVNRVLPAAGLIDALKVCPSCGKAFVKLTRKRFCSSRCQSKIYMRQRRAEERAEKERFIHATATKTRTGRRVH